MASKIFQNMKKTMKLFLAPTLWWNISFFLFVHFFRFSSCWIESNWPQTKSNLKLQWVTNGENTLDHAIKGFIYHWNGSPLENHDMQKQKCSSSRSSFLLSSSFFCTTLQSLGFFGHTLKLARHFSDSLTQPNRSIFLGSQIKMNKQRIHWTKRTTSTRGQKKRDEQHQQQPSVQQTWIKKC